MIFKKPHSSTANTGANAEAFAKQYLLDQGLKYVMCNYRCKMGEIDLIMLDKTALVFVEVRYRSSNQFGGAVQSVDTKKQMRIRRTAEYYLQKKNIYEKQAVRFDVFAISKNDTQWIQGAF